MVYPRLRYQSATWSHPPVVEDREHAPVAGRPVAVLGIGQKARRISSALPAGLGGDQVALGQGPAEHDAIGDGQPAATLLHDPVHRWCAEHEGAGPLLGRGDDADRGQEWHIVDDRGVRGLLESHTGAVHVPVVHDGSQFVDHVVRHPRMGQAGQLADRLGVMPQGEPDRRIGRLGFSVHGAVPVFGFLGLLSALRSRKRSASRFAICLRALATRLTSIDKQIRPERTDSPLRAMTIAIWLTTAAPLC